MPVRSVDAVNDAGHFDIERVAKVLRRELKTRFNQLGVLFDSEAGILVFVVDDPALALGDHLIPKFLRGQLVSPLAEGTLSELLDIALMNNRYRFAMVLERIVDRHANQALGPCNRNRLDADTRVLPDSLVGADQHLFVQKLDELL